MRELYLVPGKVHKMKTLSLRPALFGNQTVLNMNLLSILEFPPYLKVKGFFTFLAQKSIVYNYQAFS